MAYEQNNNTGSLFKNDRRQNDRQPEYRGTAIINGKEMRISAWVRTSKNGTKFFSMSFDEPYQAQSAPNPAPQPQPQKPSASFNASGDQDLPF